MSRTIKAIERHMILPVRPGRRGDTDSSRRQLGLRNGERKLVAEWQHGAEILGHAHAPGPIETGMLKRFTGTDERKAALAATVPLQRVGRAEEIAQAIVFLSSNKASFITGASYLVDGGKTAQ